MISTCSPINGRYLIAWLKQQLTKSSYNNPSKAYSWKLFWATLSGSQDKVDIPVSSISFNTLGLLLFLKWNLDVKSLSMTTWWASFIHLMSFPLHANTWHLRQNNFTLSCCLLSFSHFLEVSFLWRWWTARNWRSKIFRNSENSYTLLVLRKERNKSITQAIFTSRRR